MRVTAILTLTAAISLAFACTPPAKPISVSEKPVSVNDAPPPITKAFSEMSWTLDNGQTADVASLKGKAAILDFWATYCIPCREEIPHLNELLAKHGGDNLVILGLNVGGDEDRPKIPAFASQTKFDYPIGFPDDQLTRLVFMETDVIPQTFVIDRSGKIVGRFVGFSIKNKKELDDAVDKALASKN